MGLLMSIPVNCTGMRSDVADILWQVYAPSLSSIQYEVWTGRVAPCSGVRSPPMYESPKKHMRSKAVR
eukprot:1818852-Amphidinium_carterae.1